MRALSVPYIWVSGRASISLLKMASSSRAFPISPRLAWATARAAWRNAQVLGRSSARANLGEIAFTESRHDEARRRLAEGVDEVDEASVIDHCQATLARFKCPVRVLAIDQTAVQSPEGSAIGKTATLELTPEDSERIMAAEASGLLSLALRAVTDHAETLQDVLVVVDGAEEGAALTEDNLR